MDGGVTGSLKPFNIALDGPAGAGKSTVARMVAGALGFIYIDTGAMYRAVTWKTLRCGVSPAQADEVTAIAKAMDIELLPGAQGQRVRVDGEDVTEAIRMPEINRNVSAVSSIAAVREILVGRQKELAAGKGVVMDGRDIGTRVLPDAEVKVFLTASVEERARRRFGELSNPDITLAQLAEEIAVRDRMDSEREASPLARAEDAVLIDSTGMSLQEVVDAVLDLCQAKRGGEA